MAGGLQIVQAIRDRHLPAGSLRRSLASGVFWSLIGSVCSRGFMALSSIVVARMLGQEAFGQWGIVLGAVAMFAGLAAAGVASTATKYIAELRDTDPARAGRALSLCLLLCLGSTGLMSACNLLAAPYIARGVYHVPALAGPLAVASLMLAAYVSFLMLQGALAGFADFRSISNSNILQGLLLLSTAPPLIWFFGLNGIIFSMTLAHLLPFLYCLRRVLRNSTQYGIRIGLQGIWRERGVIWRFTLPSLLISLLVGPAWVASQALTARVPSGIAGLGSYQAASQWRSIVMFLPQSISRVVLPILSSLKGAKDNRQYRKALWVNLGINALVAAAGAVPICLASTWVMGLYGPAFRKDWDVLVLLVSSAVLQATSDVLAQVSASLDRMWWVFANHAVWSIGLVAGTWYLVPDHGIRGLAITMAAITAIQLAMNWVSAWLLLRRSSAAGPAVPAWEGAT